MVNFTNEELDYMNQAINALKTSLDECCKERVPIVDFITPEEATNEYTIIDSILDKIQVLSQCDYCDATNGNNSLFIDPLTREWCLDVTTQEWDSYEQDYIHIKVPGIEYCPKCGRKLPKLK